MLNEINKFVDILLYRACLPDVEELAKEQLMLVAAEALTDQSTESRPIGCFNTMRNGLKPAIGEDGELHRSDVHPHRWINEVHLEVEFGLGDPQLWCGAIEAGKQHLRQLSQLRRLGEGGGIEGNYIVFGGGVGLVGWVGGGWWVIGNGGGGGWRWGVIRGGGG